MTAPLRAAVLLSGGGRTLENLVEHIERGEVHIEGNPEWREHAAKVLAGVSIAAIAM